MSTSYSADIDANALFTALTADDSTALPSIDLNGTEFELPAGGDLYTAVTRLTNADVTTKDVCGTGSFDVFMAGYAAQLREEFNTGRIMGAEYTKAYVAMSQLAMQSAVQFLLGKDQAYWQAQQAQVAAIQARVALETAKLQYAAMQLETLNARANYALTKLKLATEDATFGTAKYNVENVLPKQVELMEQQIAQSAEQTNLIQKQEALTAEQTEAARAQTLDTRTDGTTPVVGVLGQQKSLYAQQVTSYQRDAEVKAAKIFSDAWITMKTIDEGLLPPSAMDNISLEGILNTLKSKNGIGLVTATDTAGE